MLRDVISVVAEFMVRMRAWLLFSGAGRYRGLYSVKVRIRIRVRVRVRVRVRLLSGAGPLQCFEKLYIVNR